MNAAITEQVVLTPKAAWVLTSSYSSWTSDFGHTSQAYWYRMRDQRPNCWPLEPIRYFLKLSMWDQYGRLWQHAAPAVVDDFGDLVEVSA